jgi:DNA-binding transcriptional LysR family regulator
MTEAQLSESKDHARGPLKITTTVAFGSTWLTPRVREFLTAFPDIDLSVLIDDEELDLGMREADVAIRMTPPRQPDLIQRHLMTVKIHIFGSVDYLKRNGIPQTLDDLNKHSIIIYGEDARGPIADINWLAHVGSPPQGGRRIALRVNNQYAIYRAVRSGLGLAALPDFMVDPTLNVVRVLPEVTGPTTEAYFVYAEELRHSKRISVFRDFLVRKVAESKF